MRCGNFRCEMPGWTATISNLTGIDLDFPTSTLSSDLLPFKKAESVRLEFLSEMRARSFSTLIQISDLTVCPHTS